MAGKQVTLIHIPAAPGTVRTYATRDGRFRVHLLSPSKRSTRNSWRMDDTLTGAYVHTWNRREAVETISRILSRPLPADDEATYERFLVFPRTTTPVSTEPFVLIDRLTGRYWLRSVEDVQTDAAILDDLSAVRGF